MNGTVLLAAKIIRGVGAQRVSHWQREGSALGVDSRELGPRGPPWAPPAALPATLGAQGKGWPRGRGQPLSRRGRRGCFRLSPAGDPQALPWAPRSSAPRAAEPSAVLCSSVLPASAVSPALSAGPWDAAGDSHKCWGQLLSAGRGHFVCPESEAHRPSLQLEPRRPSSRTLGSQVPRGLRRGRTLRRGMFRVLRGICAGCSSGLRRDRKLVRILQVPGFWGPEATIWGPL